MRGTGPARGRGAKHASEPACALAGLRCRVVAQARPGWPAQEGRGQGACGTVGQTHSRVCRHQPPVQPVHSPAVDMANIPPQRHLGGWAVIPGQPSARRGLGTAEARSKAALSIRMPITQKMRFDLF